MKNCYRLLCEQFQYRGTLRSLSLKLEPEKKKKKETEKGERKEEKKGNERGKRKENTNNTKKCEHEGVILITPIEFLKREPLYLGESIGCIGRKGSKSLATVFHGGVWNRQSREIPVPDSEKHAGRAHALQAFQNERPRLGRFTDN